MLEVAPKKRKWERSLLFFLIFVIVGVTGRIYVIQQDLHKQQQLRYELMILRSAVNTYKIVEKKTPTSLLNLFSETYTLPGSDNQQYYARQMTVENGGQVLDPFGHPYKFEPETGWISSSTRKYAAW